MLVTCPLLVLVRFMMTARGGRWDGSTVSSCPHMLMSHSPSPHCFSFSFLCPFIIWPQDSFPALFFMLCPTFRSPVCLSPISLGSSPSLCPMSLPYFPFLYLSLLPEHLLISLTPWYLSLTDKVAKYILKVAGKWLRNGVHVGMDWSWPVTALLIAPDSALHSWSAPHAAISFMAILGVISSAPTQGRLVAGLLSSQRLTWRPHCGTL